MLAVAMSLTLAASPMAIDPSTVRELDALNATLRAETFRGARSLRVEPATGPADPIHDALVILPRAQFHDGTIELRLAGEVAPNSDPGSRGFVGIAFRVQSNNRYECFYLRPTNGRADDQLRRNHSLQYVSEPEYPWERLRQEALGQYESYADLQPGEWTQVRIEVRGVKARLYVNGASQPALIVNDLKHGDASGPIALWVGPGAIGHFATVRLAARP
jgi:hypothetical protein